MCSIKLLHQNGKIIHCAVWNVYSVLESFAIITILFYSLVCNIPTRESNAIGRIRPELYQPEVMRQWSADSGADLLPEGAEPGAACGKLMFTLRYDHDVEGLVVRVSISF